MLRFLADENFNNHILRGIILKNSNIDILRVQDTGLSGAMDTTILEFALQDDRVLLTNDAKTIPEFAYGRLRAGLKIPAIFVIKQEILISQVIENILLIYDCCHELQADLLKIVHQPDKQTDDFYFFPWPIAAFHAYLLCRWYDK